MATGHDLPPGEKPMGGFLKLCVATGATLLIFTSYLFWVSAILLLVLVLTVDAVLVIVGFQFALGYFGAFLFRRHASYLRFFFRAIFLRNQVDLGISLSREDAPLLYDTVEKLAGKMAVSVPNEVLLEMGPTAWIQLRGLFRGSGKARLAIGYDFFLGLGREELEVIIAHEMAHAKLVQRGFSLWLGRSLSRLANLTSNLLDYQSREQELTRRYSFSLFAWTAELATKWVCRLVSAYYRQDEFEADHLAAAHSSAPLLCRTLKNTHQLALLSESLSWRERIARLQRGEGFGEWLKQELVLKEGTQAHKRMKFELRQSLSNRYSTHPSLKDRIAALGGTSQTETLCLSSEPALHFLAQPDALAEKLVAQLQSVIAREEERDTRALRRYTRKVNRSRHIYFRPLQFFAGALVVAAVSLLVLNWLGMIFAAHRLLVTMACIGTAGVAVPLYRLGGFRDRHGLPVPGFDVFKSSYESEMSSVKVQSAEKRIEDDFEFKLGAQKKSRRARMKFLINEGYQALRACDYLRANVAARRCLDLDNDSVEGSLMLAVSGGYFGNAEHFEFGLNNLLRLTRIRGPLHWPVGWAMMLMGEWAQAEAYLIEATRHRPRDSTIWMILAFCQARRGKLHSAVVHAREACALEPGNKILTISLVRQLLECGFVREASEKLRIFENDFATDQQLMLCIIHLNLLSGHRDAAADWCRYFETQRYQTFDLLELADIFSGVRCDAEAEAYYKRVTSRGFYPPAHLGLAQVQARQEKVDAARRELKLALNVVKPIARRTATPLQIFDFIVGTLNSLDHPVDSCTAWIGLLDLSSSPVRVPQLSLLIFARTEQEVQQHIEFLYCAMHPDRRFDERTVRVIRAPKRMQPDGPVFLGIQTVLQ